MDLIRILMTFLLLVELEGKNDHCSGCTSQSTSPHHYNCSNCNLLEVPSFPRSTTVIDLSNNKISTITNSSFSGLSLVLELYLDNNDLTTIETKSFLLMTSLQTLILGNNRLPELSLSCLRYVPTLKYLDISENEYTRYPDSIQFLVALQTLRIDVFRGFKFDERFLTLSNLSYITFNPRNRFFLNNDTFKGLSNSPIQDLGLFFQHILFSPLGINFLAPFRYMKRLTLYISDVFDIKVVMKVLYGIRNRKLDFMDISGNKMNVERFQYLEGKDVENLKTICVKEIHLSHNNLYHFPFESVMGTPFFHCLEKLDISLNKIFWSTTSLLSMLYLPNLKYLDVSVISSNGYRFKETLDRYAISSLPAYGVNITTRCLLSLEYLDISGYNFGEGPLQWKNLVASSLFLNFPNLKTVKAANTDLAMCNFEVHFETSLSSLDMSGWNCTQINPTFLHNHKELANLKAANSGIGNNINRKGKIPLLRGLNKLEYVDISSNSIRRFSKNFFEYQQNSLKNLILRNNQIERIPHSLSFLSNVESVDFSGNYFAYFDIQDRSIIDRLSNTTFNFEGNRFECSCQYVDSIIWMVYKTNFRNVICKDGTNMTMFAKGLHRFRLKCLSVFWLDFSVILLFLAMIIILVTTMGYRNKSFVIYLYLKARRMVKQTKHETDRKAFQFDAFVSYSHLDIDWVTGQLFKYLSSDLSLQVCVHHKDFMAGVPIAEEILRCIDSSRKSVFVITRNFLASEWSLFEMDIARRHVFQSDNDTILVILKENIPVHEMPTLLKRIWWRIVCLQYPQEDDPEELATFWRKLSDVFLKEEIGQT